MGRSRSRSRERGRRRSPSPERWSKRSRSRSPPGDADEKGKRRRSRRSPSPAARGGGDNEDWKREAERREEARKRWSVSPERKPRKKGEEEEAASKRAAPVYEPGSVEAQMAALGLPVEGFTSTHGEHVEGNDDFIVADVPQQRKFRQYMNKRITKSVKVPVRR